MHLLNRLHKNTGCDNLCMTGGVAMNSVANGKITTQTPFKNVYIPAGAADNGTSFGAAFYVWNHLLKKPRTFVQDHAYWGCSSTDAEAIAAAHAAGVPFEQLDQATLVDRTTDLMLDGKVVGWFQGEMEFGARALGNRTLLADPRRTDMRDIINLRIKFREKFRPFAPSILEEHVGEYLKSKKEDKDDYFFAVTEHTNDVAMLLIDKKNKVHINEKARAMLKKYWKGPVYGYNLKILIPQMAEQLSMGYLFVSGVKLQ